MIPWFSELGGVQMVPEEINEVANLADSLPFEEAWAAWKSLFKKYDTGSALHITPEWKAVARNHRWAYWFSKHEADIAAHQEEITAHLKDKFGVV